MSTYEASVVERYPDGTKWVHYFATLRSAELAVALNKEAHPARSYEVHKVTE